MVCNLSPSLLELTESVSTRGGCSKVGGDPCRGFDSWRSASNSNANVSAQVVVLQTLDRGGGGGGSVRLQTLDRGGSGSVRVQMRAFGKGGGGLSSVLVVYLHVHFSLPLLHVEQLHELHRWRRNLYPRVGYWHPQSPVEWALSAAQQFSPLHPRQSHGRGRSSPHSPSIVAASIVAADGPD